MNIGTLTFTALQSGDKRVSESVVLQAFERNISNDVYVAEIDSGFADTATFCEQYGIELGLSTNCLVIEAKRADTVWYVACLVNATDMADVNGLIRKALGARKASFASKEIALKLTSMEYGGITPLGLPADWQIYIDDNVMKNEVVVIGSGFRGSKIAINTGALLKLPNTEVLTIRRM